MLNPIWLLFAIMSLKLFLPHNMKNFKLMNNLESNVNDFWYKNKKTTAWICYITATSKELTNPNRRDCAEVRPVQN